MRKVAYVFFFFLLLGAIIVMLGGISIPFFNTFPQTPHPKVDVGFTVLNQSDEFPGVNFEDFIPRVQYLGVNWEDSESAKNAQQTADTTHIQMIRGYNLDATGNASSWLFVVRQPDQVLLVTYDHYGEKVSDWQGKFPEKEIIISQVIPPRALFDMNRNAIFPTELAASTESRELALAEGKYYLTITGQGTTQYLEFDAKTGALTS